MNYDLNLQNFKLYINNIKESVIFKTDKNSEIEIKVAEFKLELIQNKVDHSLRTVEDIVRVAINMSLNIDFVSIAKYTALLHDYGRFEQACKYNGYSDLNFLKDNIKVVKNGVELPVKNHAQFGYKKLFNEDEINKNFNIEQNIHNIIGESVFFHGDPFVPSHLSTDVEKYLSSGYLNKICYFQKSFNESERMLASTVLMLMQDVDKIDILFQSTFDEIPVIRDFVCVSEVSKGINYLVEKYGVTKEEIMSSNNLLTEDIAACRVIKIPLKNANLTALQIPDDLREKILNKEHIPLSELTSRKEHNFIAAMWWKLSEFINNMHFTSSLEVIKSKGLLEDIFNAYPDEYKFLVQEIFDFAKVILIEDKIRNSNGNILCSKQKK